MSVKLRWKKHPSGTQSAYLDIVKDGKREYKFLNIKISKRDPKRKEKKQQAESIRSNYQIELTNKLNGLPSRAKQQTSVIDYFDSFLDNYNRPGKRKYDASFAMFKKYLEKKHGINDVTFLHLNYTIVDGFKEYLYNETSFSGETPYDYFKRFRSVLNKACKENYLVNNPAGEVEVSKPKNKVKKDVLSEDEIRILAKTECKHKEVKRAFLLACFTGLGETEIKQLTWGNIANGRLIIERAKDDESINNKLPMSALKLLGERGPKESKIFNLPSDTTVKKHLTNWVKTAKIDKHITFYCGRHSFAVNLLLNGANLKTVADALGHADTKHTIKYLNYVDALKDQAMDKMIEIDISL